MHCQLVIEKDGSISNVQVIRSSDPDLEREAVRVLQTLPAFTPATQGGEAVRVYFNIPVKFALQQVEKQQGIDVETLFSIDEKEAEFPGGTAALLKWIQNNTVYPAVAIENKIQGTVRCQFVVEKDGSITNVQVVKGINLYLDREAIRVLNLLPKFKPGEQRNQTVRSTVNVPIFFKLDTGESENSHPEKTEDLGVYQSNSPFLAYPNPANDVLYIDVDQPAMIEKYRAAGKTVSNLSYDIRLYNTSGTLALQTTSSSNKIQLSISNIPDGIYFLHLYDGIESAPEVKQIVIKH